VRARHREEGVIDDASRYHAQLSSPFRRGRAGFGRRLAAVTVTAAALTAAGTLTPALAATGPSMTGYLNAVGIAVQGPHHSLRFYWARNGTTTWHPETVARAGGSSTAAAPSMTLDGNIVDISTVGTASQLDFFWAVNGSATWNPETVAGPGSAA
jgi:hypothetical protein